MTKENRDVLQEELDEFVLDTRKRLAHALASLKSLRQAAKKNPAEIDEPLPQLACDEVTAPASNQLDGNNTRLEAVVEKSCAASAAASPAPVTPVSETSSALDRLQAVKRRLAEQIENK